MIHKRLEGKRVKLLSMVRQEYENVNHTLSINGIKINDLSKKYEKDIYYEKADYIEDLYEQHSLYSEKDSDEYLSSNEITISPDITKKLNGNTNLDKLINKITFQRNIKKGITVLQKIASNLKHKKKSGIILDFTEMQNIIKNNKSKSDYVKRKRYELPHISLPDYIEDYTETISTIRRQSSDFSIILHSCNESKYLSSNLIQLICADSSSE